MLSSDYVFPLIWLRQQQAQSAGMKRSQSYAAGGPRKAPKAGQGMKRTTSSLLSSLDGH
jgi:hypothetical protein